MKASVFITAMKQVKKECKRWTSKQIPTSQILFTETIDDDCVRDFKKPFQKQHFHRFVSEVSIAPPNVVVKRGRQETVHTQRRNGVFEYRVSRHVYEARPAARQVKSCKVLTTDVFNHKVYGRSTTDTTNTESANSGRSSQARARFERVVC